MAALKSIKSDAHCARKHVPHPTLKANREALRVTQQELATLLHMSFVSLNQWETGRSKPSERKDAVLTLLDNAIRERGPEEVLEALRTCRSMVDVLRVLVRLETKS